MGAIAIHSRLARFRSRTIQKAHLTVPVTGLDHSHKKAIPSYGRQSANMSKIWASREASSSLDLSAEVTRLQQPGQAASRLVWPCMDHYERVGIEFRGQ